jgi:hypothetical protein
VSGRIDKEVAVIKQQIVSSCLQDDAEEWAWSWHSQVVLQLMTCVRFSFLKLFF